MSYGADPTLKVRFADGWRLVGTEAQPLYVRTATGWQRYPGDRSLRLRRRDGYWLLVVP
jgi:hypothetical protein